MGKGNRIGQIRAKQPHNSASFHGIERKDVNRIGKIGKCYTKCNIENNKTLEIKWRIHKC